jgi:hypothetical protein
VTQARAVLKAAEEDRLNAYVVLSLVTGIRTQEARAAVGPHRPWRAEAVGARLVPGLCEVGTRRR